MRPTSATGTEGFTLVEVLVVVAIAAILVMVASVNLFPDRRESARREAGMLALAVEHARDAAWFGGRPAAVSLDGGRVREWRLAGNAWQPSPAQDRPLAAEVTGLAVDGQALPAGSRLVFLPDGFGTPFRVSLRIGDAAWAIEGDAAGAVRVVEP